jgi:hypothetical protein
MVRRIVFLIDVNTIPFAPQKTYSTGVDALPVGLAVVDVNNDNKPDIIVANQRGYNVGVLLNSGNGTFLSQKPYPTGPESHPQCVSVVDINGDNKSDIIVANNVANGVGVFLNSGNGTFLPQTEYRTGEESYPPAVTVVDINNDKKPDIIVTNQNENNIGILFNLGDGTFTPQQKILLEYGSGATSPSVVDINDDDKPDIIWANFDGNSVGVLFNFGNGTFHSLTTYSTGSESQPRFVSVVDVNQDDKLDIVVANSNKNNVGVLLNSGNGIFLPQTSYSTGSNSSPRCVSVVDLNGDIRPEIIVANHDLDNIGIFVNIGNGTFLLQKTYSTGSGSNPVFVSVIDVNGDHKPDIIVANSEKDNVGVMLAT